MAGYYVEVWKSDGLEAEQQGKFPTFEGAIDWIIAKKFEDPTLVGRISTSKSATPAQQTVLQRFAVRLQAMSHASV
jgi:hypothetical protein